jgi:hypothetical protein
VSTYPGTPFHEKAVAREYEIGTAWLGSADPKSSYAKKFSWTDHFTGKLPLVDTTGHALAALEHVRHHDASGPLADDAVMKIADYHYTNSNFDESSEYYDQLLQDHPKSPFVRRAQLSSIDSKVKAYIGPDYDGSGLDKARDMIKNHVDSFPEQEPGQYDSLNKTLAMINDQDAERAYRIADYYYKTGKVTSAEYSFGEIPVRWPRSEWAKKAKVRLASIAKMPRKQTLPSKIMTLPGSTDPLTGGAGSGQGYGGMTGAPGGMGQFGSGSYGQ